MSMAFNIRIQWSDLFQTYTCTCKVYFENDAYGLYIMGHFANLSVHINMIATLQVTHTAISS